MAIVVAFHAGVPGFTGGFVGVDVFFVISGFLITGLLVDELRETGSISLSRFYARRVRRLLPALALVLASTLLLGSVLLLAVAGEQQDLAKSALAAALSGSNVFFWLGSNYFSEQADLMPLLHTWSLSVEEQYYLVWPTLLIALMLVARKRWSVFTRLLLTALLLVGITTFAAGRAHDGQRSARCVLPDADAGVGVCARRRTRARCTDRSRAGRHSFAQCCSSSASC